MLTDNQINQVESLFLAIDSNKIRDYFIPEIIELVFKISNKQGIYLLWLMNRWVYLRNNPKHLPTRITQCCQ